MTFVESRRYSQNIFQWNKNDINSTRMTNGDYSDNRRAYL